MSSIQPNYAQIQTKRFTYAMEAERLPSFSNILERVHQWIEKPVSATLGTVKDVFVGRETLVPGGHTFQAGTEAFAQEASRIGKLAPFEKQLLTWVESAVIFGKMLYEQGLILFTKLLSQAGRRV
jgi:hypothetical protein